MEETKDNVSFSLLSQQEIDALVSFLDNKKEEVGSTVMTQDSIDKLIGLIKSSGAMPTKEFDNTTRKIVDNILVDSSIREDADDICELTITVNETTNFIELHIIDKNTGKNSIITPDMLFNDGADDWGACIPPVSIAVLASKLDVTMSRDTYDQICNIYAERNFGNKDANIPSFMLPSGKQLADVLA
ncbi:MAG: hypothetical protein VZR00_01750 [Lachnospiraceae bacterium]|jgi:hypothetical protein|nr:hypothetical protein [Lachnospiraceae bacterium]MEE3460599.1 hypothetical protein [Lachnospiraceae bacterium]